MKLRAPATTLLALLALPACGDDMDMTSDATTGSPTGDPTGATDATTTTDPTTTNGPTDATTTTDATTDATTTAATEEPTTGTPVGLSFASDVWAPIFSPQCSCHQGGASGMFMMGTDAAAAYASMVGVPSNGSPLNYVVPGDSDGSYIFHKVNNTQIDVGGAGMRMPFGGMLGDADIAIVKQWIDDGALP